MMFISSFNKHKYVSLLMLLLASVFIVPAGRSQAAAGDIDPTFSPNINIIGDIQALDVQGDGKIIIGGRFSQVNGKGHYGLARLNPDGTTDASFNAPKLTSDVRIRTIALQADGKVLISTDNLYLNYVDYIMRLNADGSLDTSFNQVNNIIADLIQMQPDGKILIAGAFSSIAGETRKGLARLNANGTLDTSFTSYITGRWPSANLALQSDGKIVAAGLGLLRLNSNGTPDSSFDPKIVSYDCGCGEPMLLAQQVDGKIVVTGKFSGILGADRHAMARLEGLGEIEVRGQGQPIVHGDTLPDMVDGSDFGELKLGESATHSFNIHNMSSSPLSLSGNPHIAITGPNAADFEIIAQPSDSIAPSSSTSFQLRFTPSAAGLRSASISIASDDSDENPYTFALQGKGQEGQAQSIGYYAYLPLVIR